MRFNFRLKALGALLMPQSESALEPAAEKLKRDAHSFAVIEAVSRKKLSEFELKMVETWFESLFTRNLKFSVLEHSILLLMRQQNYPSQFLSPRNQELFALALEVSWDHLTAGTSAPRWPREAERLTSSIPYLPSSVFKTAGEESRVVYDTLFFSNHRQHLLFDRISRPHHRFLEMKNRLVSSAFYNQQTLIFLLVLGPMIFIAGLREIVLGFVIGMMGASINEYAVHLGIGHSSAELAKSFRKFRYFGLFAEEINLAHRVHHCKMVGDFRADFTNEKVRERVDAYLAVEAEKLVRSRVQDRFYAEGNAPKETARIISEIKSGGYGVDGTLAGCIAMNVIATPFFALNILLSNIFPTILTQVIFILASCFFLSGFIIQSMYSHRYLHFTQEDLNHPQNADSTTSFMRWFMTTSLGQLQTRRHYRHHQEKYDYQRTVNGVIMSFSFADFIFRRGVHEADISHLIKMRKEGFLNYPK